MNLIEPWPRLPPINVILNRNVLVYFTMETKKQILRNMRSVLTPDGCLLLGEAETTVGVDDRWQRVNHDKTSSYRLTVNDQ